MTPCNGCGGDPGRFDDLEAASFARAPLPARDLEPTAARGSTAQDFAAAGVSEHGLRTLRELGKRMGPGELAPLHDAIDELRSYSALLHMAAAGDVSAIDALGRRTLATTRGGRPMVGADPGRRPPDGEGIDGGPFAGGPPGGGLPGGMPAGWPFGDLPIGDRPGPGGDVGPCGLGGPHPFTFFAAGLGAARRFGGSGTPRPEGRGFPDIGRPGAGMPGRAGGLEDVVAWIGRGVAGWMDRARGIDAALGEARRWLDGGERRGFVDALRGLGSAGGLLPRRPLPSMCLDEYQVCISEFVFTALPLARRLYTEPFPPLGSVSPTDQCVGAVGPISMFPPPGQQYPVQTDIQAGTFVAIDRHPATVLSWTPGEIRLAPPPGIAAGCHVVGWVHVHDPEAVNQIRGIGEQCRPWFGGNTLVGAPYAVWEDQGEFSIVDAPVIDLFHGPGGTATATAEACRPVTLSWQTTLRVCPGSTAYLQVALLRDGQLFQVSLPEDGQLQVSDDATRTYTLRVQARIGAVACGITTRDVTVSRFNELRVAAQGNTRCVDQGMGVSISVTTSCPAPPGGLPVTVTSSAPARVAGASGTIDEGSDTTTVEVVTGNECGTATLAVSVPNHPVRQLTVSTGGDPVITAVTPAAFQTCDPVVLTVDGSCLGEDAGSIAARLDVNGTPVAGTVTVLAANAQLRVAFPPLPAGAHPLSLEHCSRTAFAPTPVTVTTRAPSIASLTSPVSVVLVCTAPSVRLNWSVANVTRVVLARGGTQLLDRAYPDPCASLTDSFTDNLPSVTAGVSYTLTAFNADGLSATRTLQIPAGSDIPVASAFIVQNSSGISVNVFLVNGDNGGGTFVGALASGQTTSVPIPQCAPRAIITIDPAAVASHNANFGDNLSATSVAVARTGGIWTRTNTTMFRGFSTAAPFGVIQA